jgi:hypothetical protein
MVHSTDQNEVPRRSQYYEEYSEYAKNLRTWLIAYGIGGPILYMTRESLPAKAAITAPWTAPMFLAGVGLQILGALLYKACTWYLHYGNDLEPSSKDRWTFRFSTWVQANYWLDFVFDGGALILFAIATISVLVSLSQ